LAQQQEFTPDKRKRLDDLPELPENRPALLLSAVYSGEEKKVYLKFYDPKDNVIYHWRDRTDHKPYCYTKMEYADEAEQVAKKETKYTIEHVKKRDIILDKEIEVLKVLAPDPLSIGGSDYSFREKVRSWEADIKYHENYLYDRSLIPGTYYLREDDRINPFEYQISEKVQLALKNLLWDKIKESGESGKEYRQYITNWANLLNQPIPDIRRVAVDIEVESEEGRMPNPRDHDRRVTAVGLAASDGLRKVLVLDNNVPSTGEPLIPEAEKCKSEKELLEKAFEIIGKYPVVLTFNGDDFDLPYLYARSQDPAIDSGGIAIPKDKVPIMVKRESFIKRGMQAEAVGIRHGIHIDLYRTFDNRSIQIYAFSRAYTDKTLNAICEALLNDSKVEFEGDISELPIQKLAEYCLKDADLTFRLTSFNDSLLMKLLVVIARIGRLSVDDIARFGVNQWIRGILYYEHRQRNELIPSRKELEEKGSASTTAVIKEKKYRGGEVVEPTPGIHFNVVVLDFASLYPSIIKVHNLSYETINCPHESCKQTKIEGTSHWVCVQRKGLTSLLIGSLRDLRVNYYKYLSKDKTIAQEERQLYNVVSQAIKVILNACFTADTDVLTPSGLRRITDLKLGDLVYTLNEQTHKVEVKPVIEVQHFKYTDSLVNIKTKDIDWQVTGNHKLYLGKRHWRSNGTTRIKFEKHDASDDSIRTDKQFLFRHEKLIDENAKLVSLNLWKYVPDVPNTIVIKPNKRYDRRFSASSRFAHYEFADKLKHSKIGRYYLTSKSLVDGLSISPEDFENKYDCKIFVKNFPAKQSSYTKWNFKATAAFELIGWYVTEGHARIGKSRRGFNYTRIGISQSAKHSANVRRIASMIQELGMRPEKQTERMFSFSSQILTQFLLAECGKGSLHKHLPSLVFTAPVELRRLLFETMMCGDGNISRGVYSSISRQLADDFRHLAFTLGIETSVREEKLKSGRTIFRVKLFKREHHVIRPRDFSSTPVKDLDVYCITAKDNHVVYAGRNGKLGWIGQSYGVMGADIFPLYCLPVADSIAAIGRTTIHKAIEKCKQIGIEVVYSDTDSIFLKEPSSTAVEEMTGWARNTLGVDLEVDKEYRYVVFSDLKKNYLGVKPDGTVDVKGLTGKKSHTPPFIRSAFGEILKVLGSVNSQKDFESAKEAIKKILQENAQNLEKQKIPLEDLSFNVTINKSLASYGKKTGKSMDNKDTYKGLPQHIKAAKMLDGKRELRAGEVISYVKTKTTDGVKPVELAKPEDIDTEKYLETMESTFEQVLSVLNFDFKSVLGKPRQQSLDELFWSK
jgi:DNA polymerase elongation subunit (family B)